MDVNCIILAGGKSTRLGRNKIVEKIGGRNLLERVISRMSRVSCEIIVVTGQNTVLPDLSGYPGLKVVSDIIPAKGSMGGLYSGLTVSDRRYNLTVACDMPFINIDLFKHMADLAGSYDAVVPLVSDKAEPLHAVYSRNCLPAIEYLIQKNRLSILELFSMINVHYVKTKDIDKFDPCHRSFFNINYEADLRAGREIAEQEDTKGD